MNDDDLGTSSSLSLDSNAHFPAQSLIAPVVRLPKTTAGRYKVSNPRRAAE